MKKSIKTVLAVLLSLFCLSGCQKETPDSIVTESDVITEETVTTIETEEATEMTTTEEVTTAVEDDEDIMPMSDLFNKFNGYNESTGYVAGSSSEIERVYGAMDTFTIHALSDGYLGGSFVNDTNKNMYRIDMVNYSAPDLIEGMYLSSLTMPDDDNTYLVAFGDTTTGLEAATAYCFMYDVVTYYAVIEPFDEDIYMVMPLIGGNDELGYWAVLPTLTQMGFDTTKSTMLASISEAQDFSKMELAITDIEYDGTESVGKYNFTNGLDVPIFLSNYNVYINGTDVTDDFLISVIAAENSTLKDEYFFYKGAIYSGDELVIHCEVFEDNDYSSLGFIEFAITLK